MAAIAIARLSPQVVDAILTARRAYAPRQRLRVAAWAERYRRLASGEQKGGFTWHGQPALRGVVEAFDEPGVHEVWVRKSAQLGYTQSVVMNLLGARIHQQPSAMLVLFPKDQSAKRFVREKFDPMVTETPVLARLIPVGTRKPENTADYKRFPGGFIQCAGTNSPANVKSTDAPLVIVEEPDDTAKNVKGQGDAVALGRERMKGYSDAMLVVGGTPTVKGVSKVDTGMARTDLRVFLVECPHCGHRQTLRWSRVRWRKDAMTSHPVYGAHLPDSAVYACEACVTDDDDFTSPGCWANAVKNRLIREAAARADFGWQATARFDGVAGFSLSDLLSVFPNASMPAMVRKFIDATHALANGDDSLMRSFVNNQLGEAWEIKSDAPEIEQLVERCDDYAEWTCPAGGLVCTGTVDVQRGGTKIAAGLYWSIVAWGRGEESWRVARGVVLGNPLEAATWDALDEIWNKPIRNAGGGVLGVSAVGIDSSDGMTSEAVYRYVRPRKGRGCMAIKGSSNQRGAGARHKEIFSPPSRSIDTTSTDKAAKWGLKVYQVGTDKAKDLIAGRLSLTGSGPGRMHFFAGMPQSYFQSLTSEVKMPGRSGRMEWTPKAGTRQEDLDQEVYHLHAARKLRLHTWTELQWADLEARLRQQDLLATREQNKRATTTTAGPSETRPSSPAKTGRAEDFAL